jgi:hypothetical protein
MAAIFFAMKGPDLSSYEPLREPRIATMQDTKMLVVEAKGDPNAVGQKAFDLLFKVYYRVKGTAKGPRQPAPRARWIGDQSVKSEWTGYYGLPVPDDVTSLPATPQDPDYRVSLGVWKYGTVAEILHVGPYSKEEPTIEKITKFVRENGYEIAGPHEEEYLQGPGLFFKGNPEHYYTIIRYTIKKARGADQARNGAGDKR